MTLALATAPATKTAVHIWFYAARRRPDALVTVIAGIRPRWTEVVTIENLRLSCERGQLRAQLIYLGCVTALVSHPDELPFLLRQLRRRLDEFALIPR